MLPCQKFYFGTKIRNFCGTKFREIKNNFAKYEINIFEKFREIS
jgi:hypothetical protein